MALSGCMVAGIRRTEFNIGKCFKIFSEHLFFFWIIRWQKVKIKARILPTIKTMQDQRSKIPINDHEFQRLPEALRPRVRQRLEAFFNAATQSGISVQITPEFVPDLLRVWACSEFVANTYIRHPALLGDFLATDILRITRNSQAYRNALQLALNGVTDEASLSIQLRKFRQTEMVRIAWRDLSGWADLNETMADLSGLADACIDLPLSLLHEWQCTELGVPTNPSGDPQSMVVLGMGKLGARELNFSSDVDLIFTYPEEGETTGGRKQISNNEYFLRLGRRLINVLNQQTPEGFVFRVDMRLRPFGNSGPLAINFEALENYYQIHGREWERYAMIKARAVAGDIKAGESLLRELKPFVYRRYLDFGAFESLREMKNLIVQEVQRKGLEHNIKLGPGGIREIEFIGQAFQLIRGGRHPALQDRQILTVLKHLKENNYLPEFVTSELKQAYLFLRNTEHRLQQYADQQTHTLPTAKTDRQRLAYSMGFDGWETFETQIRKHRQRVHNHFEQVFASPQTEPVEKAPIDLFAIWQGSLDQPTAIQTLKAAGFDQPEDVIRLLEQLHQSYSVRIVSTQGRIRLDRLMPLLIGAVGASHHPERTMQRMVKLLETIARRTAYVALLVENPMALSQLVKLFDASSWITEYLIRHPILLDELLDARILFNPPRKKALVAELHQRTERIPLEDLEQQMESLRHFKQVNILRVAAADVLEALPLMVVSDHLTWIAETVLQQVLTVAWHDLVGWHGSPVSTVEGKLCDTGFAIIAYGKLGGIELGYGSDLDLVFLHATPGHATPGEPAYTNGPKPIENAIFFTRLGQRIIHILNTLTPSGVLYDVDMRLRPSGASGMLVSNVDAYADYQANKAWTWEHQALVRARPVAGDARVAEHFNKIRHEILGRERNLERLKMEVRDMRTRMRVSNEIKERGKFDLKQGAGGIADIEFMVQYGVLAWSAKHPALLRYSDNIRLLESFGNENLMASKDVQILTDAYRFYRAKVHKLNLQDEPAVVDIKEFAELREDVIAVWQHLLEEHYP
jgi:glutamate-ammonia-ligase adenylyltransferase